MPVYPAHTRSIGEIRGKADAVPASTTPIPVSTRMVRSILRVRLINLYEVSSII